MHGSIGQAQLLLGHHRDSNFQADLNKSQHVLPCNVITGRGPGTRDQNMHCGQVLTQELGEPGRTGCPQIDTSYQVNTSEAQI